VFSLQVSDSFFEVEALMEKMRQLQECRDEEEASQEEMASRFEIEKRESMFVFSSGNSSLYIVNIILLQTKLF
jgi:sestrin